ncbi:TPA-induced transmembrane protein [Gadus macrocephalus]|uniref:TPA-induced transmembrane protein n=1 Tax=Gadus macrocephalus TaxID=80720 RepID=UPI0028CBA9EA|nr:TPA-induced transmembrane protein [Gadus macrocephalus]
MTMELQSLGTNRSNGDGADHVSASEQVQNGSTPAEQNPLLSPYPESNGDVIIRVPPDVSTECRKKKVVREVERLTTALNAKVFWKCSVWMTILFLLFFIAAVIFISIVLCSVFRKDPDDTFDRSSYEVPRDFNGTFRLTNQVSAEELLTSSNQSQVLASQLQKKLYGLYSDSPALGRYFSNAEIYDIRNGSTEAVFGLSFLLPRADQERLRSFTLSRQLVYNVLRQALYDQDTNPPGALYIEPGSLQMN